MINGPENKERRFKILKIDPEILIDLLTGKCEVHSPFLPEDAEFRCLQYDVEGQCLKFIIKSKTYGCVTNNFPIPQIELEEEPMLKRKPDISGFVGDASKLSSEVGKIFHEEGE